MTTKGKAGKPPEDAVTPQQQPLTDPASAHGLDFRGIHADFLADTTQEVDIEGARNSGKTWACCARIIKSCEAYPGIEWLMCRYSGEETKTKLRPEFVKVCAKYGYFPHWDGDESCYVFPNGSKVFAYGLRTQNTLQHFAKIRGLGIAAIWVDQTEELPEEITTELRACTRQQGYPHSIVFSPNPPPEDHYLTDQFPEDNSIPNRHYYRVSIYDNAHNLPEQTILQVEQAFPLTHPRRKSMVLGERGPNVIGTPVYESSFIPELHLAPLTYNPESPLLEAIQVGLHHPVWIVCQRNYFGGIEVLGGILGKRLFLEDFLPIVEQYRTEWFPDIKQIQTYCDPPPSTGDSMRFTNIKLLREAGLRPRWKDNGNAADVREAIIQSIVGHMHRRLGKNQAFVINNDPRYWLMASHAVIKHSRFFMDGCATNYVWDDNLVSVGHKKHRQPKADEWTEGGQRCLENLVLNCWASKRSQAEQDDAKAEQQKRDAKTQSARTTPHGWLGT